MRRLSRHRTLICGYFGYFRLKKIFTAFLKMLQQTFFFLTDEETIFVGRNKGKDV